MYLALRMKILCVWNSGEMRSTPSAASRRKARDPSDRWRRYASTPASEVLLTGDVLKAVRTALKRSAGSMYGPFGIRCARRRLPGSVPMWICCWKSCRKVLMTHGLDGYAVFLEGYCLSAGLFLARGYATVLDEPVRIFRGREAWAGISGEHEPQVGKGLSAAGTDQYPL